MLMVKVLHYV